MASGKFQTHAAAIQNHFLLGSSVTAPSAANVRISLCVSTGPNSNSVGTELSSADGYTAGGIAVGFGTPVEGDPTETDNDAQIQWTNAAGGGGAWTQITGCIIHRGGGTVAEATCMYFVNGLTVDVPDGATLTITAGNCSVTEA